MMFEKTLTVLNVKSIDQIVWIEPWGDQITLPPGATFEFRGRGPIDGDLEMEERDNQVFVFAWPSSVLSVTQNGRTIWSTDIEAPPVPDGTTLRGFVTNLFHRS